MKERLLKWFGADQAEPLNELDINHAAAALMVEIMAADDQWDKVEAARILELLQSQLGLTATDAAEILDQAKLGQRQANDLFQFTSVVNRNYDNEQKYRLLKQLWLVAYADGRVDRYEEHMIRKLADLLHMPHSQFIRAKIEART